MIVDAGFAAFRSVDFHYTFDLQQVWMDQPNGHLPLQRAALDRFNETLQRANNREGANPLGLCLVGPAGSGKTHLLGEIRREAATQGANFVLSDLTDVRDFWPMLTMHYLQALQKPMQGVPQLQRILEVLLAQTKLSPNVAGLLDACRSLSREHIVSFANEIVPLLRPIYGHQITGRLRALRALLYLESDDSDLSERAYSFLQGVEQIDEESKRIFLGGPNDPKRVAIDLAWFLSICGVTVLAFDQLDPFVAQNNLAAFEPESSVKLAEAMLVLSGFVNGVVAIRQEFAKTLVVVACLESTWKVLQQRFLASFQGRFQEIEPLQTLRDARAPRELVGSRLTEAYDVCGYIPPYPTWPFAPEFFSSLPPGLTPREILYRCNQHRIACVRSGAVTELHAYRDGARDLSVPQPDSSKLDAQFERNLAQVDTARLLDEAAEDELGHLIAVGARILCRELPSEPNIDILLDDDFHETKQYQSLHVRMRRIFHAEGEREDHVCIRVLMKSNYKAFEVRLLAALTMSGMSEKLDGRRLVFLRNSALRAGTSAAKLVANAKEHGAEFASIAADDVRVLAAVVELSKSGDPLFETWLLKSRPLSKIRLFQNLIPGWFGEPHASGGHAGASVTVDHPPPVTKRAPPKAAALGVETNASFRSQLLLGVRMEGGSLSDPVYMPPVDLTRHVILRAGSGGGKTVFVKRLVEEAALCGVSSIVIDTAKDLSMLGDRWEHAPASWTEEDARLAEQYHRHVDVQIWTPGHSGGRPMRLAALPNLSGPFEEAHDREQAVEIAVAGLMPLAVQKKNATVERAVLKKVVEWLTRRPQHSTNELDRLIAALRELPAETMQGYRNERRLAEGMADQIQATLVGDSLYSAQGEDFDPAMLLGVGEKRARVSVLSLFAMADIASQARFIGQMGSALFNWIRRNAAPAGAPVRGLLVLDEAARFLPRGNAESKPALMLLAAQARKYGLGLVLATQNPMDLDYNATANFATQLFGTANTPQVVRFIQEAMEQRGLTGWNPGQLKTGQFFCATPSLERPVRLQGPMSLSAHPHNVQLTDDDILARSKGLFARAL